MFSGRIFTDEQVQFILDNYKGRYAKDLWTKLNKEFNTDYTYNQVMGFTNRHGLRSGLQTTFQKGRVPFNKGMKQEDYMSPDAIKRASKTQFVKGDRPANYVPIGYERLGKDGYIEVKVGNREDAHSTKNFEAKQRVIWKEHHGEELEKGDIILFLDQDNRNFDIDNLVKVTRADLVRMNRQGLLSENADINQAVVSWSKLQQAMKEAKE